MLSIQSEALGYLTPSLPHHTSIFLYLLSISLLLPPPPHPTPTMFPSPPVLIMQLFSSSPGGGLP